MVTDVGRARAWLTRYGLGESEPPLLLARRLAARRRAKRAENLLLGGLFIVAALTLAYDRLATAASDGALPHRWVPLALLSVMVIAMLMARSLFTSWVGRVDRLAAASLSRRVTLSIQQDWWTVIGGQRIAVGVAVLAVATALAAAVLTVAQPTAKFGAAVLLVSLSYVAIGNGVQLRRILARPAVAEDAPSLMADVVMRIEDARELVTPPAVWSLPVVLLFSVDFGWWTFASFLPMILGIAGLKLAGARSPSTADTARQAVNVG